MEAILLGLVLCVLAAVAVLVAVALPHLRDESPELTEDGARRVAQARALGRRGRAAVESLASKVAETAAAIRPGRARTSR